jgi:glycerol dehydrogenase-like iron-containing ADH family enzyme
MGEYMKALTMGSATVIMDPTVAKLLKDSYGFESKDQLSKWFSENVEKTQYPSNQKVKPFQESSVNIVVTGGGGQTTWFVTDFMMSRNMVLTGGSTRIDDWR